MKEILSVEKPMGEETVWFTTDEQYKARSIFVDRIVKEEIFGGKAIYNDLSYYVYRGYKNEQLVFEWEANSGLLIYYKKEIQNEPK